MNAGQSLLSAAHLLAAAMRSAYMPLAKNRNSIVAVTSRMVTLR